MDDSSVTVVTITRHRPELLLRAIESVRFQRCSALIRHLVCIDDCPRTRTMLESMHHLPANLVLTYEVRRAEDQSGPKRLARLRNAAVETVDTEWIAFLDDDNEFAPEHLQSLIDCAQISGAQAVHSHLAMYTRDGHPYLEERYPWTRSEEESREMYEYMSKKGVFTRGSNIVRDRVDPLGSPDAVRTVDTGEWLLARSLLLQYPFPTEYTPQDWEDMTTEDDKLMEQLVLNRVLIACTGMPTLKYYLGGYSNSFAFD